MTHATIRPEDILKNIVERPRRLLIPVLAVTLISAVYAVVRPNTWEASQALVVRDESGDRLGRSGKLSHNDEMKAAQETILELAKSRSVLTKALATVGPPANRSSSDAFPSEEDVENLQGKVKVTPPKGGEFGKTEVFYLKVQDSSHQRAVALASSICEELQARFDEFRAAKAHSTTAELTKTVALAQADLDQATKALSDLEKSVGKDLAELRMLTDHPSGDSDLRRTSTDLEREIRGYHAARSESQELLKLLKEAEVDPNKLLASPSALLKSQPALGRLKDGLVDAQLRSGQALGTMSPEHPMAVAAQAAQQAVRDQLHNEIGVAIKGIEADMRVNAERLHTLEQQRVEAHARLEKLAEARANYSNLVASVKTRSEALKTVENDLSEARASHSAAQATSLINLIDTPVVGSRPVGPGRTVTVLGGFGGGVLLALAIVFLTVKPSEASHFEGGRNFQLPAPIEASTGKNLTVKQALKRVSRTRV